MKKNFVYYLQWYAVRFITFMVYLISIPLLLISACIKGIINIICTFFKMMEQYTSFRYAILADVSNGVFDAEKVMDELNESFGFNVSIFKKEKIKVAVDWDTIDKIMNGTTDDEENEGS